MPQFIKTAQAKSGCLKAARNRAAHDISIWCVFLGSAALASAFASAQTPDVAAIVKLSAETNDRDFAAASKFNYKETDKLRTGTRTFAVTMIEGTPYQRVIANNGEPLSQPQAKVEERRQQAVATQRKQESQFARSTRIAKFQRSQQRDHAMMSQLSAAFDFILTGEDKLRGFPVWTLKATPKPGYRPPTIQAQVLPGMQGELWIDKQTYEWVKVNAIVTRPVSIEGFLAVVEPGTRFEIEKNPVQPGIWQITHYSAHAVARVLHLFDHGEEDDVTFFDFQPASGQPQGRTAVDNLFPEHLYSAIATSLSGVGNPVVF